MIKDRVQKHVLMRKIHFHLNLTMSRYPVKILIRRISLNTAVELNWPIKRLFPCIWRGKRSESLF